MTTNYSREVTAIPITTNPSAVAEIEFGDDEISVEVHNTGTAALTAFEVKLKPHPNAAGYVLANDTSDFADTDVIGCVAPDGSTADPTSLAAGARALITIPRQACSAAILTAKCGTSTTISARWGG